MRFPYTVLSADDYSDRAINAVSFLMGWNSTCISWGHLGAGKWLGLGSIVLCGLLGFLVTAPTLFPVISFPLLLLLDAPFPSSASNIPSVLLLLVLQAIIEQLVRVLN